MERVAIIAAIEHYTAFLGDWVLNAEELVPSQGGSTAQAVAYRTPVQRADVDRRRRLDADLCVAGTM